MTMCRNIFKRKIEIEVTLEIKVLMKHMREDSHKSLQDRFSEHKGYGANSHLHQATGGHFNTKGHKIHHMKVTIWRK